MKGFNIDRVTVLLRRLAVCVLGAVLIVAAGQSGVRTEAAETAGEVLVGAALPLSGSVALLGQEIRRGYELAAEEINAAGGIKSLGGAKLRFVFADHRGIPDSAVSETERLILKENVSMMVDAYQSGATYPASTVAERYGVPYLVTLSTLKDITRRGYKYIFRAAPSGEYHMLAIVDFVTGMNRVSPVKAKTIAIVYEDSGYGQQYASDLRDFATKAGLELVLQEGYPATTVDLTNVVLKLKRANPDVIVAVSYITDAILLVKTMDAMKVVPKAFFGSGAGYASDEYFKAVGSLANGQFMSDYWAPDLPGELRRQVREKFAAKYGGGLDVFRAAGYRGAYIAADVLERAGSTNREKIRDAFRTTHIVGGPASLIPMRNDTIMFGEDGQAPTALVVTMEARNGSWHTVWPSEFAPAGNSPTWPSKRWSEMHSQK